MRRRIATNPKHVPKGQARKERLKAASANRGYQKITDLLARAGI